MKPKITVRESDLVVALETSTGGAPCSYIHRATGGIILVPDNDKSALSGLDDPTARAYLANPGDFTPIDPMPSFEAFGVMEAFVATVEETGVRDALIEALRGRRPFRRFSGTLPDSHRDAWNRFRAARLREYAVSWLGTHLPDAELAESAPSA